MFEMDFSNNLNTSILLVLRELVNSNRQNSNRQNNNDNNIGNNIGNNTEYNIGNYSRNNTENNMNNDVENLYQLGDDDTNNSNASNEIEELNDNDEYHNEYPNEYNNNNNLSSTYINFNNPVILRSNLLNYLNSFSDTIVNDFIDSTLTNSKPVYKKIASNSGIEQIIEVKYSESEYSQNMCPIYCCPFSDGDIVCKLPCNHIFSKDGIHKWLKESYLCPVCRFELDYIEVRDCSENDNNLIRDNSSDNLVSDISSQYFYVNNYPSFNLVNILLHQQQLEQFEYQETILRSLSEN